MKRRTFIKAVTTAPFVLAAPTVLRAAGKRTLRIGVITPASHFWSECMVRVGESLSNQTSGAIEATVFPSGQLGNEPTMIQQIQAGSLDMGFLTVAEFSNRIDDQASLFAPYLVSNVDDAAALLKGPTATAMLDQYTKLGMKGLGFGLGGMRHLIALSQSDTANDLAGKKFRITPFAPLRDFYDLMNVAPTPIPLPGLFDALANGQVDGADIDLELAWKLKLFDKARNLTTTNHMMFPNVAVMSGRTWASLDDSEKKLVADTVNEELGWLFAQYSTHDPKWLDDLKGTGITVQAADQQFFGPVLDEWSSIWEPKAPSIAGLRAEAASL